MTTRETGENFKVVLSTKKTLFGVSPQDFTVYYADVNDLATKTVVPGGVTEAVETIPSGSEHTATLASDAPYGAKLLFVDSANSTLEEGDVIQYATGKYAYIRRIVSNKVYLKTPIRTALSSGDILTQVGNTGEYVTPDISIQAAGEYIVAIEGSDYGILVEQRVKVVDPSAGGTVDTDAPEDTIAVAY